ncbi:MAG: fibronectin type III domain-containing protein, partial [Flavobacteriaceae bacterium]|nr:fibronectin type III domain-containing protein [Flavobacteriaceae bacterium]
MMNNYNSLSYRKLSVLSSQEPEVVGNSPNSSGGMRTSWLMSLMLFFLFFMAGTVQSQVSYSQNWTATGLNSWTTSGSGVAAARITTAAQICGTGGTIRTEQYYGTVGQFISPSLGTSNGGLVTVSYSFKATQFGAATTAQTLANLGTVTLEYGSSAAGPWTIAQTINSSNHTAAATCATKTATFTPSVGALYIRYNVTSATGADTYYYFDDVVVSQLAVPPCSGAPNAGVAAISSSSGCSAATVNLSATGLTVGTGITYQWQSSPDNSAWTDISGATSTTYSATTVVGTRYYKLVTTCSAGPTSTSSSSVSYVGSNCGSTNVPATGSNLVSCGTSTYLYDNGGAAGNYTSGNSGYTVLDNSGTGVISISGSYTYIEGTYDFLKIYSGVGTGGTLLYTYSSSTGGTITPFSSAAGQSLTVQFTSDGTGVGAGFSLQALYSGACALCSGTPSALVASAVTDNSATISWTAPSPAPASGYDYYYSTSSTAPTAGTTPSGNVLAGVTSKGLTSLSANTPYYYWVRANCDGVNLSAWSLQGSFTTPCLATTVPYSQNFESAVVPALPGCTSVQNAGTGNNWITASNPGYGFTTTALRYPYNGSSAANSWFYTNGISLTGGTSYTVSYNYGNDSTFYVESLKVAYGTSAVAASMTTVLATHASVTGAVLTTNTVTFTPASSGVYYFGFNAYSIANQSGLMVDDIAIYLTPTCYPPTALTATAATTTGITLNWTAPALGTPVTYEYEVRSSGAAGSGASGLSATGIITAPTATAVVTGLPSSSSYSAYVRTLCGGSDTSFWTLATNFNTLCTPEMAPTVAQTFATFVPNCWTLATGALAASSTVTPATNGWFSEAGFANTGTNKAVRLNLYGTKNDWLISNEINLGSGGYRVRYKMAVTSYLGSTAQTTLATHKVDVVVSTDGGATWSNANVVKTYTGAGTYSNTGQTEYVNLVGYTGAVKIAFVATTTSTTPDIDFHVDDFQVELIPTTISSFAPSAVCSQGGETVTISGFALAGATSVKFNGVDAASFTVVNGTTITAVTPSGVTSGVITVVAPTGTATSATSLTVNANPVVSPIQAAGNVSSICMPSTLALTNGTALGVWSVTNGTGSATITAGGILTGVTAGTVTVNYTVTDLGCPTKVTYGVVITEPVAIGLQPVDQNIVSSLGLFNASFTLTASGTGITYQWEEQVGGVGAFSPISNGGIYGGATSNTLVITSGPETMNTNVYQCVVTGTSPCGPLTSNSAALNVGNTGIATQPTNSNLCDFGTATFTVVSSGTVVAEDLGALPEPIYSYQWYEDTGLSAEAVVDGGDYSGAHTATLTITNRSVANSGTNYYVIINGPANDPQSVTVTLNVNTAPSITDPTAQTVCYTGGTATFTAAATGSFTGYKWQYSADNSTFTDVVAGVPAGASYSGATTGSLVVTTTAATPVGATPYYRAVALASSPCVDAVSIGAQLIINNPTVTTGPVAASVLAGGTATFSVAATAASPLTYQWQYATALGGTYANVVNGTPANVTYTGATSSTLSVVTTGSASAGAGNFYRVVLNPGGCSKTSTGAALTITNYCIPAPTSVDGTGITKVVIGTINNTTVAEAGNYGNYTNLVSNVTQLVPQSFAITYSTGFTYDTTIWLDANNNGAFESGEIVYQGVSLATNPTTLSGSFTIPLTVAPGNHRLRIGGVDVGPLTNPCYNSTYGTFEDYTINVVAAPACSGTPVAGTAVSSVSNVCFTGTATLSVSGYSTGVTGISLQWYNSAGLIAGATNPTFTTPVLSSPETYFC